MARARNIKPGFFKNEDLAECSPWARLCFAGLWTLADREGRLEDRAKRIKGELFAFDTIDIEPLLTELEKYKFITRYASEGRGLIQINEFAKHQHPHHKEPESAFPSPQSPGLLLVASAPKPEALASSDVGKASDKPETLGPIPAIPSTPNPADSLSLESGTLIPDSGALIPERRKRAPRVDFPGIDVLVAAGFDEKAAEEFIAHKAAHKAPLTDRAWRDHLAESVKAGWSPLAAAEKTMAKHWKGFEAKYVADEPRPRWERESNEAATEGARRLLFGDKVHA